MIEEPVYKVGFVRSHVCGNVAGQCEVGAQVSVTGWVSRLRQLGGLTFFELLDRFGSVQCVLDAKVESSVELHRFDVIRAWGRVREKPQEARREGKTNIEILVDKVEMLNATAPLPLSMDEGKASETTRLKYRYLDLRRPEMWRRLQFKSDVYQFTRMFFHKRQFLEVETPMLYRSTPEGARDYVVPSRLYPEHFYALPQSPQMLKQLLMISGVDRYMQIVRCFRDEDLRQNRQPEFTQLDLECAFVDEASILQLLDEYFLALFSFVGIGVDRIERMSYKKAMLCYGSDRPDLRYPEYVSVKGLFEQFPFAPLDEVMTHPNGDVVCLPIDGVQKAPSRSVLSKIEQTLKTVGCKGVLWCLWDESGSVRSNAKAFFSQEGVCETLRSTVNGASFVFIIGGDQRRYEWMAVLRKTVIDALSLKPRAPYCACWVTDFPLFETGPDGEISPSHHPFTSPHVDWIPRLLMQDVSMETLVQVPAQAYDIVINGEEVGGGSVRIHDPNLQRRMFEILGLSPTEIDEKFGFFLEALGYGAPPHGGIALGMDRLVAVLDGHDVIRDYIAFPKTQNAQCLMSGAPAPISSAQREELGLKFRDT